MSSKLGTYLKKIRMSRCLSLSEVGEYIGVSPSYIFRLENGERKNPSISVISKICNYYNLNLSDVLRISGIEGYEIEDSKDFDLIKELKTHDKVVINDKEYLASDIINILTSLASLKTA